MPLSKPSHGGVQNDRSKPGQQHWNHHRTRKIGKGNRAYNQHRDAGEVSDFAPGAIPARRGLPIAAAFDRKRAWNASLRRLRMMMEFARVQMSCSFERRDLRAYPTCLPPD